MPRLNTAILLHFIIKVKCYFDNVENSSFLHKPQLISVWIFAFFISMKVFTAANRILYERAS